MKMTLFFLGCFIAAILSSTALAVTIHQPVTPANVREHPKEWSVEVTKGKNGLIHFVIKHDVETPKYHVAHLAVYHQGRLIATSDTPLYGTKQGNTFYVSLAPEDLAESEFSLSENGVSGVGAPPAVGGTVYQFRLLDFVPEPLLKSASGK
jgi:hypothetical protein